MAKLVFLGRLEDLAGAPEIPVAVAGPTPLAAILERFSPELVASLGSLKVRIALNGTLIGPDRLPPQLMIADSDEVAFLPPVSGG